MRVVLGAKNDSIQVSSMKDGEIAIITSWGNSLNYLIGRVIQRYGDTLVSLGMHSASSWDSIPTSEECMVRLLSEGDIIKILND